MALDAIVAIEAVDVARSMIYTAHPHVFMVPVSIESLLQQIQQQIASGQAEVLRLTTTSPLC